MHTEKELQSAMLRQLEKKLNAIQSSLLCSHLMMDILLVGVALGINLTRLIFQAPVDHLKVVTSAQPRTNPA